MFQLPLIIMLEIVSPESRSRINGIVHCFWTFGLCLLALIAFLTRSWLSLSITTSCIALIPFLYLRFFPESPSWLITNQRYGEALTIVKGISEKNGKTKDSATLKALIEKLGERCRTKQEVDIKHSTLDILKYSKLRKIFITLSIMWATVYLAYYGLQLNIYNLMGNEFVNFSILSLAEIPGCIICWYMLDRFGRRFTLATNFIFMGLACLLPLAEHL
ncbi:carcinine transporter-like [Stegodyphus dumicola]|uniref:carcinine transporter-like n=1 Tax=Stegodyphus dumicola TaxID=202533 RepID=UPI0015B23D53|nr:carcinine transporter-like [Stegodyphus dumicola]